MQHERQDQQPDGDPHETRDRLGPRARRQPQPDQDQQQDRQDQEQTPRGLWHPESAEQRVGGECRAADTGPALTACLAAIPATAAMTTSRLLATPKTLESRPESNARLRSPYAPTSIRCVATCAATIARMAATPQTRTPRARSGGWFMTGRTEGSYPDFCGSRDWRNQPKGQVRPHACARRPHYAHSRRTATGASAARGRRLAVATATAAGRGSMPAGSRVGRQPRNPRTVPAATTACSGPPRK